MAAAGAEIVHNGGCGPDDLLYLEGNPEEDRPKVEKFLHRFKDAGMQTLSVRNRQVMQNSVLQKLAVLQITFCMFAVSFQLSS